MAAPSGSHNACVTEAQDLAVDLRHARDLVAGLRALKTEGLLCNVALLAGDGRFCAHQAVLAAASNSLRDYFVSAAQSDGGDPAPLELELQLRAGQVARSSAVAQALGWLYGEEAAAVGGVARSSHEGEELLHALGVQGSLASSAAARASRLLAGLRMLRAQDTLCDLHLLVGGECFKVHQSVLAAASLPLRRYLADSLNGLRPTGSEGSSSNPGSFGFARITAEPLELELQGSSCPEAIGMVLDHIYGENKALKAAGPLLQELLRLASVLELPLLLEQLAPCENSNSKIGLQASPHSPKPAAVIAEASDLGNAALDPPKVSKAYFNAEGIPEPGNDIMSMIGALDNHGRRTANTFEKLQSLFLERPVWLEEPLKQRLPPTLTPEVLMLLLPLVAYQWGCDGPWQTAYTRHGWDPRDNAEEAKSLQVLEFQDPYFRRGSASNSVCASPKKKRKSVGKQSTPSMDCHFRRPPSCSKMRYQLVDIKDEYVALLVDTAEVSEVCNRQTGWLDRVVYEGIRNRLVIRSQQMREKLATKEKAARAESRRILKEQAARAERRRSLKEQREKALRPAKRARTGGA